MSEPKRASSNRRGAFPGRNPGTRTSRASFLKASLIARSNSSAGTVTCSLTLLPSSSSTVLCIRRRKCTERHPRIGLRRESPLAAGTRAAVAPTYDRAVPADRLLDRAIDRGVTHVALPVRDLGESIEFYDRFADMHVVHRRAEPGGNAVAWISDLTRPFVLVLIETGATPSANQCLGGAFCHVGMAVASREDVDRKCELARAEGRPVMGP